MSDEADAGLNKLKKRRGGARPNSGPKKGAIYAKTLEKVVAREYVRQKIQENLDPILDAHIANAVGRRYLVKRDKRTGKFTGVTEEQSQHIGQDEELIEVWDKDPSAVASVDLLNRYIDKPAEQEQKLVITATVTLPERIRQGRARLKSKKL